MNRWRFLGVAVAVAALSAVASASVFTEDFESYAVGSDLHGQAGWKGWDNAPGATGKVSDKFAFSGNKSVEILGSSDQVHEFTVSGGKYVLSAMQYIPSGGSGQSYFILLSVYKDLGPNEWSVQTVFDCGTGAITPWHSGPAPVEIIFDEWVEVKCIIDLEKNGVDLYYNGEFMFHDTWSAASNKSIQAIDLYGNSASSVYYDDVKIEAYQVLKASSPSPADGGTSVTMPLLKWVPGDTALFHDIYLGTSADLTEANKVGARVPFTMYYHMSGFEPGATYYWRVDEIDALGNLLSGDVWSFSTAPTTAYAPSPWDNAKGVDPQGVQLSWSAATTAQTHDVYFGKSKDDVAGGGGDTFKGNQPAMTYTLGALDRNTTYYWRVDEVESAGTKKTGPVWSFTTISPSDGVKAQYFNGMGVSGVPVLTQVEPSIDHNWGSNEVAAGLSDSVSARWTAILEVPATGTYTLVTTSDDGVRLWLDGRRIVNNWTDHSTTNNPAQVDLVAGQPYLVVMEWYENSGGAVAQLSWESSMFSRQIVPAGALQLPLRAVTPSPMHEAQGVSQTAVLRWTAGEKAVKHAIYFGEDKDAVANGTDPTALQALDKTTYDPGTLEWNKTYYWRVDEVNDASADSPWQGSVWSFTTADFVVVDDFEAYTDNLEAEEAIFQTWIDGETNSTGSTVGYFESTGGTFSETAIVHDGRQSMPLDYNNVDAPFYSETERTWSAAQDWTINGGSTLVLYVRGKGANKTDQSLYVGIEDKAGKLGVVVNPDTAIFKSSAWVEWRIPLSDFGVNAAAVKKMIIGVGNRSTPATGSAGLVFIDGIRVVK